MVLPMGSPPVGAAYQFMVAPAGGTAFRATAPGPQRAPLVTVGMPGLFTISCGVDVAVKMVEVPLQSITALKNRGALTGVVVV